LKIEPSLLAQLTKVKFAALSLAALTIGCEVRQKKSELPRGDKETILFNAMDRKTTEMSGL